MKEAFDFLRETFGFRDLPPEQPKRPPVTIDELVRRGRSTVRLNGEYYRITVEQISEQEAKGK